MAKKLALIGMSLSFCLLGPQLFAQSSLDGSNTTNTITTAVPFLRISPDARSGAMGDVGIALSPDANSQHWNLAKIPFAEKKNGLSLTYTPWLKELVPDIFLAYISGYTKFGEEDNQSISASFRYFSLGEIDYRDDQGASLGTGKPNELALDLGYSRKLSEYLSAGIGFRFIHSAIASGVVSSSGVSAEYKPGNAFAADLGVFYTKTTEIDEFRSNTLALGGVISNLGSKITYSSNRRDFIPMNLGLGGAYTYKADEYNQITFALDINKLLVPTPTDTSTTGTPKFDPHYDKSIVSALFGSFGDAPGGFGEEMKELQISVGTEYWYQNQFAIRAGYFYEHRDKGDRKYLTVGVGAKYQVFNLNFAYLIPSGSGINRNPLANTLRFSLMFEIDKINKSAED